MKEIIGKYEDLREKEAIFEEMEFDRYRKEAKMDIEGRSKSLRSKAGSFFDSGPQQSTKAAGPEPVGQ
jgi:hypothetical protein